MEVYAATLQKNVMQSLEQQTSNVVARLEGVERAVRAENQLTRDAITGGMTSLQRLHESSVRQLADVTETNARQLAGVTADVFKALTVRPWSALGSGGRRTGGGAGCVAASGRIHRADGQYELAVYVCVLCVCVCVCAGPCRLPVGQCRVHLCLGVEDRFKRNDTMTMALPRYTIETRCWMMPGARYLFSWEVEMWRGREGTHSEG